MSTAEKAEASLYQLGRSELALGHRMRADPESNIDAFADIEATCRANAAALKERGLPATLVQGAANIEKRLVTVVGSEPPIAGAPVSAVVANAAAFVGRWRDAIVRVSSGPRNAEVRRKFGIHKPFSVSSPTSVRKACENLMSGKRTAATSAGAALLIGSDLKTLATHIKAIKTETSKAKKARSAGTSRTTERDILNATLELFYDRYAAAISLVLNGDEVARLKALKLVPRKVERRGSGTPSTTTTAPPAGAKS